MDKHVNVEPRIIAAIMMGISLSIVAYLIIYLAVQITGCGIQYLKDTKGEFLGVYEIVPQLQNN